MTEAITITHLQNASGGILTDKELKAFLQEIKTHPVLRDKPEALVNKAFLNALKKHRAALKLMDGEELPFKMDYVVASCEDLAKEAEKVSGKVAKKAATHAERVVNEFKHMQGYSEPKTKPPISKYTHEQKMNAGIAFVMAALSALGAVSSARSMKTTDDDGKTHWSATAVGFTLLQGVLAAGMAHMGVQTLRGAPAGRA